MVCFCFGFSFGSDCHVLDNVLLMGGCALVTWLPFICVCLYQILFLLCMHGPLKHSKELEVENDACNR